MNYAYCGLFAAMVPRIKDCMPVLGANKKEAVPVAADELVAFRRLDCFDGQIGHRLAHKRRGMP